MRRFLFLTVLAAAFALGFPENGKFRDLHGNWVDPFSSSAHARVFLFVRTDCPITNRYAPELQRLASQFKTQGVDFWLVYPDGTERPESVKRHIEQYQFPGVALLDPRHQLVALAHVTVAPEAAVFSAVGILAYHGRIDDRYIDVGKSRPGGPQTHDLEEAIARTLSGKPVLHPQTRAIGCSLADIE
ncbi:MAG: redoxin domain-containing protein [Acidobacteriaceae bacterium]|nr:redoxin domain-containing protein [Acidobacteriaceae bacterium]